METILMLLAVSCQIQIQILPFVVSLGNFLIVQAFSAL